MYNIKIIYLNNGGENMQNNIPYLDILIFGVIAIFLIFRLKNILGTNIKSSLSLTNRIDFSDVPKGTYFLLLEKENEKIVKQILVN